MSPRFTDRAGAGQALAEALAAMHPAAPLVLALPRGGVPVAAEVARRLGAPLELLLVRKIGVPGQPELALAAVVDLDPPETVVDEALLARCGAGRDYLEAETALALREIERRRRAYGIDRRGASLTGRTAILVDDGIATGTTVRAALRALRRRGPAQLWLAVPVAPPDTLAQLRREVDALVCLHAPPHFQAVGAHYRDFHQLDDDEVMAALGGAG